MDDWTYPYYDPDADAPSSQPMLLDPLWDAVVGSLRADNPESAAQAAADRPVAEENRTRVCDQENDGRRVLEVPLPFEAPARTSPTY